MAKDMPSWQSWIGHIALQGKLMHTAPIRFEASIVDQQGNTTDQPHRDANKVLVTGYLLCKADSLQEVQEWAKTCPILRYPHSSVEIRALVPFPVQ